VSFLAQALIDQLHRVSARSVHKTAVGAHLLHYQMQSAASARKKQQWNGWINQTVNKPSLKQYKCSTPKSQI